MEIKAICLNIPSLGGKEFSGSVLIEDENGKFIGKKQAEERLNCLCEATLRRYYKEKNLDWETD
jgi:hypothetical protein